MTPEDLQLDPEFFLKNQPLTLYRLARARYANLSGAGAAFAPGRWNPPGKEAIYTSTEMGVPVLERLVHTPKNLIPSNLAMMKIRISGDWEMQKSALVDPRTGGFFWFYQDLASARIAFKRRLPMFAAGVDPFAVALPSVIVPVWNVVLFRKDAGFGSTSLLRAWKHFHSIRDCLLTMQGQNHTEAKAPAKFLNKPQSKLIMPTPLRFSLCRR
ncbi:MAG: RES family NAD+ phosphorylase [Terracidiphilus sp.]